MCRLNHLLSAEGDHRSGHSREKGPSKGSVNTQRTGGQEGPIFRWIKLQSSSQCTEWKRLQPRQVKVLSSAQCSRARETDVQPRRSSTRHTTQQIISCKDYPYENRLNQRKTQSHPRISAFQISEVYEYHKEVPQTLTEIPKYLLQLRNNANKKLDEPTYISGTRFSSHSGV